MSVGGSCLCGAVRFVVEGPLRPVIACHCAQCRKTSGHHVAATSAPRDAIRLESEGDLRWYRSSPTAQRGFCGICGSNLFWAPDAAPRWSIFAGCLDGATGLRVESHIFCADKADYYEIADSAPQYPQGAP